MKSVIGPAPSPCIATHLASSSGPSSFEKSLYVAKTPGNRQPFEGPGGCREVWVSCGVLPSKVNLKS